GLRRCGVANLAELLAHEIVPAGVLAAAGLTGPVHTLYHPRLSHSAGRAFFQGGVATLPYSGYGEPARIGARSSLLRRFLARHPGGAPDAVYADLAREACRYRLERCTVVLADWSLRHPGSPALAQAIARARAGPMFGGMLADGSIAGVRAVLAGAPPDGDDSIQRARDATQAYVTYYDHAFPFDAPALLARWDRCVGPESECAQARAATRRLLADGGRGMAPVP